MHGHQPVQVHLALGQLRVRCYRTLEQVELALRVDGLAVPPYT